MSHDVASATLWRDAAARVLARAVEEASLAGEPLPAAVSEALVDFRNAAGTLHHLRIKEARKP